MIARHQSLSIRQITCHFIIHPERDPGVLQYPEELLRPFIDKCRYALVVMDRVGCGAEQQTREVLEAEIEQKVNHAGWANRCAAVVINPELEQWVWSNSRHVDSVLGWEHKRPKLRNQLKQQGMLHENSVKPDDPKSAMEWALRIAKLPRSSSLYFRLAQTVSLADCIDPSFLRLKGMMQQWFGVDIRT